MLRIIDRYLLRELLAASGAVGAVLLLVVVGGTLSVTLDRVARGVMPASLLLSQIGLRSVDTLPLILPLALFLGVLLANGRLYRDSEMAVLAASGVSSAGLLRPAALITLPAVALLALLSFWLGPAAVRQSDAMVDAANRSLLVIGMEAGRFVELRSRNGVVFVGAMSPDGTRFERLFVHESRDGRVDVTTAANGELFQDRVGGERYLALYDGFRVEGKPGEPGYRMMRFARNDIRLDEQQADPGRRLEKRRATRELLASEQPIDRAEFHFRLGLPLSALLLALLAVPLSRSAPREPRYAKILLAVLAYVVYTNLLNLGRGWLADGTLPAAAGLWWLHGAALLLALVLLRADARSGARRGR
ncbi:MAG: LPS export ABC transporter permease LptF [Xanthomonadaceae bacterium]|nr:LPS export ABC transporter permease LptF [Xanthomonadaceae bacterium]